MSLILPVAMKDYLPFEKPIADLENKILQLREIAASGSTPGVEADLDGLQNQLNAELETIYENLDPWNRTRVARHAKRPHSIDYINALIRDFTPLCGDRAYGDDKAVIGGVGWLGDDAVMAIGHEKGDDTEGRIRHNFGMAHPEGYRKARRLMELADRYGLPVLTFVDTPGAYPGIEAEERGQAEAIARSTEACLKLEAPLIALVIGEGGSGGAVALASADVVLMLEHAVYTVASPEAAASILWRDPEKAGDVAKAMKITAADLHALGVIDRVIEEPIGGAHRDPQAMIARVGAVLKETLSSLIAYDGADLRKRRSDKYLSIGRPS